MASNLNTGRYFSELKTQSRPPCIDNCPVGGWISSGLKNKLLNFEGNLFNIKHYFINFRNASLSLVFPAKGNLVLSIFPMIIALCETLFKLAYVIKSKYQYKEKTAVGSSVRRNAGLV